MTTVVITIDVELTFFDSSNKRIVEMERQTANQRLFDALAGSVRQVGDIVTPLKNEWEAAKD